MAMTQYTGDTEIITNIGTTPQERGLTTDEFKAKFDEGLKAFVAWFNDVHKTEFDAVYSEGTWTPVLAGATTAGSNTYTKQTGKYIKQNKKVTAWFNITLSAKDASMAPYIVINNLPFTAANQNINFLANIFYNNFDLTAGKTLSGLILGNTSRIALYEIGDNTAISLVAATQIQNTTELTGYVEYFTD
jgi:hypothetical protein